MFITKTIRVTFVVYDNGADNFKKDTLTLMVKRKINSNFPIYDFRTIHCYLKFQSLLLTIFLPFCQNKLFKMTEVINDEELNNKVNDWLID